MKLFVCVVVILWSSVVSAGEPYLVKDLNLRSSSFVEELCSEVVEYQGAYYFCANSQNGRELWVTDGTEQGTSLVSDIVEPLELRVFNGQLIIVGNGLYTSDGTTSGTTLIADVAVNRFLAEVDGKLLIAAGVSPFGSELWVTDGTVSGTLVLLDETVGVGIGSGLSRQLTSKDVATVGDKFYFRADTADNGEELWVTDGTLSNTKLVKDIFVGTPDSGISNLVAGDGFAIFRARVEGFETELWRSDGSSAGTFAISEFDQDSPFTFCESPVRFGSLFLFCAQDTDQQGRELWATDGTLVGTRLLKNIAENDNASSTPRFLMPAGELYYFVAGEELWSTDGTEVGTVQITDRPAVFYKEINSVMERNGELLYIAETEATGVALWTTNSSTGESVLVKDFDTSIGSYGASGSDTELLGVNNGLAYFVLDIQTGLPTSIWKTDGTEAGTVEVGRFPILSSSPFEVDTAAAYFSVFDDFAVFGGGDPILNRVSRIWLDNSTGPSVLREITPPEQVPSESSRISEMVEFNGKFYFLTRHSPTDRFALSLWQSDGTRTGTRFIKEICDSQCFGDSQLVATATTLFILELGQYLWKSDGTADGTTRLKQVGANGLGSTASKLTAFGNDVLFVGWDQQHGLELWKSNGSAVGTVMVKDIDSGFGSSFRASNIGRDRLENITDFAVLNNVLYFAADDGDSGAELWRSGGTESSTFLVKDIFEGETGSFPQDITLIGDTLYFSAFTLETGYELWKSKGSASTTVLIKDIEPRTFDIQETQIVCRVVGLIEFCRPELVTVTLPLSGLAKGFVDLNGKAIFRAYNELTGYEVWVSNGTSAGTFMLKNIRSGSDGSSELDAPPRDFDFQEDLVNIRRLKDAVKINNELYFVADGNNLGSQLWKTNGTSAGTLLVKHIAPGVDIDQTISELVANPLADKSFFFRAEDANGQVKLWQSDGTRGGTVITADVSANPIVDPKRLLFFNNTLYFSGNNGYGR